MQNSPTFPTPGHAAVAKLVTQFFKGVPETDTILVVNSCARGQATADSDLDFAVLLKEGEGSKCGALERKWLEFIQGEAAYHAFKDSGPHAHVHLDVIDGQFGWSEWDEGGGPDFFEVEIGNRIAHSAPMGKVGSHFKSLKKKWLPYYDEESRLHRLEMVVKGCNYHIDHAVISVHRGLNFHAFDLLYRAMQEFLQALFISRKVYPLAYNKWIRYQIEDILGMMAVYVELERWLAFLAMDTNAVVHRAEELKAMLQKYV